MASALDKAAGRWGMAGVFRPDQRNRGTVTTTEGEGEPTMPLDSKKLKAAIDALGGPGYVPTDEEMLRVLKDAGAPDVPPHVLAAVTPETINAFGFQRLMEEGQALARALFNATLRCRVCEVGKPRCAQCIADLMPLSAFTTTMACISQLVAARCVADKAAKGGSNGPFEIH